VKQFFNLKTKDIAFGPSLLICEDEQSKLLSEGDEFFIEEFYALIDTRIMSLIEPLIPKEVNRNS